MRNDRVCGGVYVVAVIQVVWAEDVSTLTNDIVWMADDEDFG